MAVHSFKKVITLILFALIVHSIILKASFDIYFSSPVDQGMTPVKSTNNPPAKRLVFIVADGLRAEALFGDDKYSIAPNLNFIVKTIGSWGTVHTRVPTESRPGHVALLAGIYEDPAAILKGWKANPVDFDSVINQSTNAWCWGGPSIMNLFRRDNAPHIHLYSYDPNMEDYGKNNTIALDKWVFMRVHKFLSNVKRCYPCRKSGNLYFLHLLGTDTAGHAFKPDSMEYKMNIQYIDEHIPKLIHWFNGAFDDNGTAFVFTSDHGMTNWGSHGAGSKHETEVPFIAWGAGIKNDEDQKDIEQIDVAPLLSALIGINYPINSLGRLPSEYIDVDNFTLNEMLLANVQQLMEIFDVKRWRIKMNTIRFVPFRGIHFEELQKVLVYLKNFTKHGTYPENFEFKARNFMNFLIKGTDYYHNYYQLPLLISITFGLVFWIIFLVTYNITIPPGFDARDYEGFEGFNFYFFVPVYMNLSCIIAAQDMPPLYYLYFLFPVAMMHVVSLRYKYVLVALRSLNKFGTTDALIYIIVYVLGLRVLVDGFKKREYLALVLAIMAIFPLWSRNLVVTSTPSQKYLWIFCCMTMSGFLFLPVMSTKFHIHIHMLGYLLWWLTYEILIMPHMAPDRANKYVTYQQLTFRFTIIYTVLVEYNMIEASSPIKYFGSALACLPILMIPLTPTKIYTRLVSIFLAFETYYLMVTFSYENAFLNIYSIFLLIWLKMESQCCGYASMVKKSFTKYVRQDREQSSCDFRRAFFFVVMIFLGFFGTGNIASLSSFNPMWVRCFLTIFSPFKMSALILLKIAVPFIFATCVFRAVNLFRGANTLNMFCIVLVFSDIMLLELLYYITNIGSWLEIGTSLSQFIIMEAFVIILLILYGFSYILTRLSF